MRLNASRITKVEEVTKSSLSEILQRLSVKDMVAFVYAGLGLQNMEKAQDALDKYLEQEENSIITFQLLIQEKLMQSGFFPKPSEEEGKK